MLKHPDPEVQLLVEMLEGQRDAAMAQAAALFRSCKELEGKIAEFQSLRNKELDEKCENGSK